MHYALSTYTAAVADPVSVSELRQFLRIDFDADDQLLANIISAATQALQIFTNRQFVTATLEARFDDWPEVIHLPRAPLASVSSVSYVDTAGDSQTLAAAAYTVDIYSLPGRITEAYGYTWPAVQTVTNAVTVRYIAGYGAATAVPLALKHAIMIQCADMYEHREQYLVGGAVATVPIAERLAWAYRVLEV